MPELWVERNRERSREIKKEWKKRNREAVNAAERKRRQRNPERIAEIKRACEARNREAVNLGFRHRRAANPFRRISDAIGCSVRESLKGTKNGRKWRDLVGYNVDELRVRLDSQFREGMNWENYGEWHIDHIKPVAAFDFSQNIEQTIRECWALENLQPLWAKENMRKGAKW